MRAGALGGAHGQAPTGSHITNQPVLYKEEKEHRSVLTTCMRTGRWPGELQPLSATLRLDLSGCYAFGITLEKGILTYAMSVLDLFMT